MVQVRDGASLSQGGGSGDGRIRTDSRGGSLQHTGSNLRQLHALIRDTSAWCSLRDKLLCVHQIKMQMNKS